jgi:hypothetical protein
MTTRGATNARRLAELFQPQWARLAADGFGVLKLDFLD